MRKIQSGLLFVALGLLAGAVDAQAPTRVRGTVTAFDFNYNVLSVKTKGGNTDVVVVEKTEIITTQPIPLSDIKPGDFLGVTSAKAADGTLTALEIRRFPKPNNPGHRPFDGRDDQTMTNASVSSMVQSARGDELMLTYAGGTQKIVVPESAAISALVPGNRLQLVSGAAVNLTARPGGDGMLTAIRIQVSPPKP
jgi:hypothetical protein